MKASIDYFSPWRPFDAAQDACLLDGIEQLVALTAESGFDRLYIGIGLHRLPDGTPEVEVTLPGDDVFRGPDIRTALRSALNEGGDVG
jgi:hypothetical protein